MPRGRVETQTPIADNSDKIIKKDFNFFPIPTHMGFIKVIAGGFDPDLPDGRIIPFFASFTVKVGQERDFVKISSMYPVALLIS